MTVHGSGSPNDASATVATAAEPAEKPKAPTPANKSNGPATHAARPEKASRVTLPANVTPGNAREATKTHLPPVPVSGPPLETAIALAFYSAGLTENQNVRYPLPSDSEEKKPSEERAATLFRDVSYVLGLKTRGDPSYAAKQRAADELVAAYQAASYPNDPANRVGLENLSLTGQSVINLRAACDYALEMFALYPPKNNVIGRNFANLIEWIKPHANERAGYNPGHEAFERLDRATQGLPVKDVIRILARLWVEHGNGNFPIANDIDRGRLKELAGRFELPRQADQSGPRTPDEDALLVDFVNASKLMCSYGLPAGTTR